MSSDAIRAEVARMRLELAIKEADIRVLDLESEIIKVKEKKESTIQALSELDQ